MLLNLERVDFLISQYVAGVLPEAAHVLMGSHLAMQATSGRVAQALEDAAGTELAVSTPSPIAEPAQMLQAVLTSSPPILQAIEDGEERFPAMLRSYAGKDLSNIPWRMKLPGLRQHVIEKSASVEASLLWARPGRALPTHGHHGLELTLVLDGEFRDYRGSFLGGDVSVADEAIDHRPVAGGKGPCLCFSVLFAPIALTGSAFRLIGDVLGL